MSDEEVSDELMLVLLDSYSGSDAKNKAKQSDLCSMCIASGNFVNRFIYPESLKGKETQFASMLGKQEERLASLDVYELLAKAPVMGSNSKEYMQYALDMAEKHPDNMLIQSVALEAGTGYRSDSKTHYDRTAKVAKNLLDLYRAEGHSAEELESMELSIASSLMLIGKTSDAMELINAHKDTNQSAAELYIANLYNSKKYTEAQAEAKAALSKWENDKAAYLMGLSALKNKDAAAFVDSALYLSLQIKKSSDKEVLAKLDNEMYILLESVVLSDGNFDSPLYTLYKYGRTDLFPEEDLERIAEDPFLSAYLGSVYDWTQKDYDTALKEIDAVLEANDALPLAHYHKGILLYQRDGEGDLQLAKKELNLSASLDDSQMTTWYMIACTCDKLGEYPEALNACNRVLDLNPDSDHGLDVFGVGVHAQGLKSKLENYIREGK